MAMLPATSRPAGARTGVARRPRLGIVKMASCDGCQLTLLDLEDELLDIVERFELVEFAEASSHRSSGPYDILLVEGSVSTPEQAEEIVRLRRESRLLVTIGACATAGGIQALGRSRRLARRRLPAAGADRVPRDGDPDQRPRHRRRPAPRLPHLAGPAPRADHRAPGRPPAAAPRRVGLRRLQAARDGVRPRQRRRSVPRPGDPDGLRRPLPGVRARPDVTMQMLDPAATAASARTTWPTRPASPAPSGDRNPTAWAAPTRTSRACSPGSPHGLLRSGR